MINQQLVDYIKSQVQQGADNNKIKNDLLANGWKAQDIEEAFVAASGNAPVAVPMPSAQNSHQSSLSSIGTLLDGTWSIFKKRFLVLLGIIAIPFVLAIIVVLLIVSSLVFSLSGGTASSLFGFSVILSFCLVLIVAFVNVLGQIAVLYAIKDREEGIGILESYKRSLNKFFPWIWLIIINSLIVAGGMIPLIIPGIILSLSFSFGSFILVSENKGGLRALLRSREYIRGYWWPVFGRVLVMALILLVVLLVGSIIGGIVVAIIPFAQYLLDMLASFLVSFSIIYSFLIYENLKSIKGDFVEEGKNKTGMILLAVWGIIASILFFVAMFFIQLFLVGLMDGSGLMGSGGTSLYAQARDSQRISDMAALSSVVSFYISTTDENELHQTFNNICKSGMIYSSDKGTTADDGTGWLPIDFGKSVGGSLLPSLPVDPVNTGKTIYKFSCNSADMTFELNSSLESSRYKNGGTDDRESTDGGDNPNMYEIGNALGLDIIN